MPGRALDAAVDDPTGRTLEQFGRAGVAAVYAGLLWLSTGLVVKEFSLSWPLATFWLAMLFALELTMPPQS
jgi:hypothetical protein